MKNAPAFICAKRAAFIRFSCLGRAGARHTTWSDWRQQRVEFDLFDARFGQAQHRVAGQHAHAQRLTQRAHAPADLPVADDAERRAPQFAAHDDGRRLAGAVGKHAVADAAAQVDHRAQHPFGHRGDEASAGMRHQHAGSAGRGDIDVADVHRAAQEHGQLRAGRKQARGAGGLAVADDHLAALHGVDQRLAVERGVAVVQSHLTEIAQTAQRLVAVVPRAGGGA